MANKSIGLTYDLGLTKSRLNLASTVTMITVIKQLCPGKLTVSITVK